MKRKHTSAESDGTNNKQAKKDAEKLVSQAVALQDKGKYEEAEKLLLQALNIAPGLSTAKYNLGVLALEILDNRKKKLGDREICSEVLKAIQMFQSVINSDTSGRGDTAGLSYRALANALSEYEEIIFDTCSKNEPLSKLAPFAQSRESILQFALINSEKSLNILGNDKSFDEYVYEFACINQQYFSLLGQGQNTSLATIFLQLNVTIEAFQRSLQTALSSNIDRDIYNAIGEVLNEFWLTVENILDLTTWKSTIVKKDRRRSIFSNEDDVLKLTSVIKECINNTTCIISIFNDDVDLMSLYGDLLTSCCPWYFFVKEFYPLIELDSSFMDLLLQCRNLSLQLTKTSQKSNRLRYQIGLLSTLYDVSHSFLVVCESDLAILMLMQLYQSSISGRDGDELIKPNDDDGVIVRCSWRQSLLQIIEGLSSCRDEIVLSINSQANIDEDSILSSFWIHNIQTKMQELMPSSTLDSCRDIVLRASCLGNQLCLSLFEVINVTSNAAAIDKVVDEQSVDISRDTFVEDCFANLGLAFWKLNDRHSTTFYLSRHLESAKLRSLQSSSSYDEVVQSLRGEEIVESDPELMMLVGELALAYHP